MAETTYVTCAVCGYKFKGKVPKGGDGSVLFPYKHYQKIYYPLRRVSNTVCPGSYREAKEY